MPGAVTWAEGALTPAFLGDDAMRGSMHSCFERVVNLAFPLDESPPLLLTVTRACLPQLPDSLRIPAEAFAALRALPAGVPVLWQSGTLSLPGQTILCGVAASTLTPWKPPALTSARAEAFLRLYQALRPSSGLDALPERPRASAVHGLLSFLDAVLAGHGPSESWPLGLGGGTTPAGDDAMVGILSALGRKTSLLTPDLLEKTADISAKYLRCAQEGYFSAPVRAVWEELSESALKALARVGGTSGADMLFGMALACRWRFVQRKGIRTESRQAFF